MATNKFLGTTTLKFLGASTLNFIDPPLTVSPSIQFIGSTYDPSLFNFTFTWRVTNFDPLTAIVVSNFEVTPPTDNSVGLGSNEQSSDINSGIVQTNVGTIYARATAVGKAASNIASLYIQVGFPGAD